MPDRTHRSTKPETSKKITIGSSRTTETSGSTSFTTNPKEEVKDLVKTEEETPTLKQFDRSGYNQGQALGKGAFGTVYQMDPTEKDKKKVALKTSNSKDGNDDLTQEAEVLEKLGPHENIVGYEGLEKTDDGTNLALEYLGGGDMQKMQDQLLAAYKARKISHEQYWGTLQYLLRGVSSGIGHMNEKGMIHGDLKGGNVGISEDLTPKVIDFGTVAEEGSGGNQALTPVVNYAPERGEGTVKKNNDVYAIGQMAHASGHDGQFHATGKGAFGAFLERGNELDKAKKGEWEGFGEKTEYDKFLNQTLAPQSEDRTEAKDLGETNFLSDSLGDDEMAKSTMRQLLDDRSTVAKKDSRGNTSFDYGAEKSELDLVKESKDNRDDRLAKARVQNKLEKKSGKEALKEQKQGHTKKDISNKSDMLKELKKKTRGTRKSLDKDAESRRKTENLRAKTEKKKAKTESKKK